MSAAWGYSKANGPDTWARNFPLAAGSRQSPVDIKTNEAKGTDVSGLEPLTFKYTSDNCMYLTNTGYGWKVGCCGDGTELRGGPLKGKYILEQFHCHWGPTDDIGSEHTVDGKSYSAELHFVHWNASKYESFGEAAKYPDGLAVVAVFFKVGKEHQELRKLTALLSEVVYKDEKVNLKDHVSIEITKLMPDKFAFWTYPGSLTTPPCSESVDWLILKEPVEVSKAQLSMFRMIRNHCRNEECAVDDENGLIVCNYRPVFSLDNREIRECGGH